MSSNPSPPSTPTTPSFSSSYTLQQQTRSTLPAECLVMIFNYLDQDRSTLHALLRVNHHFFQLTVPILYRSPFRLLESRAEAWSWSERTQRQVHLLQLFMHVVQVKQIDRHEATTAAATAAIKSSTRTGTQRKWRHPQSPDPHSDYITANPITITATTSALSSPTGSSGSNGIAMDRGQPDDDAQHQQKLQKQQQPPQTVRRQRRILRFKSGTQPWWAKRRPSSVSSSSTTTAASSSFSSSSSSSSSFSFSSNRAFSSPSCSYSSSSSVFSAFFGSKKESNAPLVPGNIQEAAACSQQDKQNPFSTTTATTTTDNQQHLLHDHPTLAAVAVTDNNNNNKDKCNNPVPHTTYLNYPIARSRDIITNNSNDNNNNNGVIDCGQHRSHRLSEPPQQTDLCLRYYFDPDDSHSPSPSPSHQHNDKNDNNKHIRFGDNSGHSSGNPFEDTDHHNHHRQLYSHTYIDSDDDSIEGNDSYDDDDDDNEYGINRTLVDTTTTFSPWCRSLEPDLGPFNTQSNKTTSNNWTRALQQRLRCMTGLGAKETTFQEQHHNDSSASEGVMADYLQHYIDQSHPGLVRILPFVFPTLPAEAFDQLSYSRAMIPTATPLPGHEGSVSPSTSHSVLNIFNTLQPSHGSNLERAQSIRVSVERDLLHHSPHRINTIAVSVSRLPAIMSLPQRQSTPSLPSQRRGSSTQSTTTATGGLHSTAVSSLTSLFSFLSSSPFSTSPLSNMPTATSSSSSLSSLQSTQSSCSTTSSSSVPSIHTDSWTSTNRFGRLRHLTRIEFHDIHHKFDEEAVVNFLTSHSRTYDTIREVKIGGPNDIGKSTAPRVVRILSCLRKVKVLDMTEWREAIKYLEMIPTQHLETLLLGNVRMTNNPTEISEIEQQQQQQQSEAVDDEQQHKEDPQILALQQCRRLRELRMPVLVDGLFEWAVQERQIRLSSFSRPSLSWSSSSELPYWVDGPSPVQLENVHLSGSSTGPLISTLLHVVDAFRDSLQVLQSTSWIDSTETGSCSQSLAWTWCLPNLQVLDLQGEIAYRFKIQSLESCPQLRVLRLTLPHCFLPSSSYSPSSSTAGSGPVGLTALTTEPGASVGQLLSSSGASSPPSSRLCTCHCRDLRQRQQRQQRHISLADVLDDDDSDDSDCTCHTPNKSNSANSNISPPYIGQDRHRHRYDLFPRLEELKLVGDWGLTNESLLGIAKKMPRLERLSLLRCESEKLTALGLIRAMPSLRGNVVNDDNGGGSGRYNSCRVRWMEICKSWQCEIGAAFEYDDGCCEGESDSDRRRKSETNMAFVAAVKGGVCPLHIDYQY